ncbi:hypothetical protein QQ73_02425, partial [Candidatus Endoriftia persephone str. Guaymas]|nr:hypothetical protein [Candidatus Endoriftia persephone str. Guaymas]
MILRADLDITLTFTGPFLTKSSAPGDWGLDETLARDGADRHLLPGTLVVGKLRQAWEELADLAVEQQKVGKEWPGAVPEPSEIARLLGGKAYGTERTARPKRLRIGDFTFVDRSGTGDGPNVRYRICIDPKRGAAQDRAQLLVESPYAAGEAIRFRAASTSWPKTRRRPAP